MRLITFIIAFVISGCSSVNQNLEPEVYYEKELKLKIDGMKATGYVVAPWSVSYDLEIKSPEGRHDLIFIRSCNREVKAKNEGKYFSYKYTPVDGIETNPNCPLHIVSLDKKGRHSWAFIAFEDTVKYRLSAYQKCNGEEGLTKGVSICQAKMGLLQEIKFSEPVIAAPDERCNALSTTDQKTYRYEMPRRECAFLFRSVITGKEHLHYTIGYEESVVGSL